jgi:hypothetical protein
MKQDHSLKVHQHSDNQPPTSPLLSVFYLLPVFHLLPVHVIPSQTAYTASLPTPIPINTNHQRQVPLSPSKTPTDTQQSHQLASYQTTSRRPHFHERPLLMRLVDCIRAHARKGCKARYPACPASKSVSCTCAHRWVSAERLETRRRTSSLSLGMPWWGG